MRWGLGCGTTLGSGGYLRYLDKVRTWVEATRKLVL